MSLDEARRRMEEVRKKMREDVERRRVRKTTRIFFFAEAGDEVYAPSWPFPIGRNDELFLRSLRISTK